MMRTVPTSSMTVRLSLTKVVGFSHGRPGSGTYSRSRGCNRATTAAVRVATAAVGDGARRRARHQRAGAPDGRGRDGGRQEFRLPRTGDPGRGGVAEEDRRLDPHDLAPGAIASKGPAVPPRRDASG